MSLSSTKSRNVKLSVAVVTASVLLAACGGDGDRAPGGSGNTGPVVAGEAAKDSLEGVTLTFVSYGGIYQEGQMKAAVEPFGEITGAEVLSDGPTEYAKIRAQVESGNVVWDVVDTAQLWAEMACGKWIVKLDYTKIDASKIPEGLASDCYVPAMTYSEMLVYNAEKFPEPPTSWADFFDVQKFPGKRGLYGLPEGTPGVIEAALLADGVRPENMYPIDFDRAFAKLNSIKDHLVLWQTGAQAQQMLESGEVAMAYVWSGRAAAAAKNGAPIKPVWNDWFVTMDVLAIPKGAPNPDASHALINYYLGAEQQAKLTELTTYAPVNIDAKPKVDETTQEWLSNTPERMKTGILPDMKFWSAHYDELNERWAAWLGS